MFAESIANALDQSLGWGYVAGVIILLTAVPLALLATLVLAYRKRSSTPVRARKLRPDQTVAIQEERP